MSSTTTNPPALKLSASAIGYERSAPVLRDVGLQIARGECVGLLGGNGTGKTTLLKAVVGLVAGSNLEVEIGGQAIHGIPARAIKAGAGMVMQNPDDQLFCATPLEDAMFGPRNQGRNEQEARLVAQDALRQMGVEALADRPIETLSFGEKKRVCIAAVLSMQPKLLLLDEPTAGLDPSGEMALLDHLSRLANSGVAMMVATHAVDLVGYLMNRVVLLGDGRVLADGTPETVFDVDVNLATANVRAPWVLQLWRQLHSRSQQRPLTVPQAVAAWSTGENPG